MRILLLLLFIFIASTGQKVLADAKIQVIGYLPEYRLASIQPEQIRGITTLIYFGIEPQADGKAQPNIIKPDTLSKLTNIKKKVGCKLLLCAGGWGRSAHFPALAATPTTRKQFIDEMLSFCIKNGFNGIDYDWEHPKGPQQMANYQSLLQETAKAFHSKGLLVTCALANWQNLGAPTYQAIDQVHLMSYDHAFPQATYEKSSNDVAKLIKWGCPPQKIALGIPFYGRNKQRQSRTYAQLVGNKDLKSFKSSTDLIEGFAFNSKATLSKKIQLVKTRKLAGLMIWELGQDSTDNNKSLLQHIQGQR